MSLVEVPSLSGCIAFCSENTVLLGATTRKIACMNVWIAVALEAFLTLSRWFALHEDKQGAVLKFPVHTEWAAANVKLQMSHNPNSQKGVIQGII